MLKTTGALGGAAAIGTGAVPNTPPWLSWTQDAEAIAPLAAAGIFLASAGAGASGVLAIQKHTGLGSGGVDENQNSEDYVYQVARTVVEDRKGPTGSRTELQEDFANANTGDSGYARTASDMIVNAAALATLEGRSSEAQTDAVTAHNKQTARAATFLVETWNQGHIRLIESGALVEEIEQGAGVLGVNDGAGTRGIKAFTQSKVDNITSKNAKPVKETEVQSGGYACWKVPIPNGDLPVDPTTLDNRDEPLELYCHCATINSGTDDRLFIPDLGNWTSSFGSAFRTDWPLRAEHSSLSTFDVFDKSLYGSVASTIQSEYSTLQNELPTVVNKTVNGLQQGSIKPSEVLDANDLVTEFDPSNSRQAMAREMMSIGASVPTKTPAHQVKISHPDLTANSLWVDLYLRLADGVSDITINGPMTIPKADYELAWIGHTDQTSGEYINDKTLPGTSDLQILEVDAPDSITKKPDTVVEADGDVVLGEEGSKLLPTPIKEPDPKYNSWGISVKTADGSTDSAKVSDTFIENGKWKVATNLNEGQSVTGVTYHPDVTYESTTFDAYSASSYDPTVAQKTIERRRDFNDAVDDAFSSVLGGGSGSLFEGLPSLPGFGPLESAIIVILGLFGLNAASN
jgi:hypothetical protein